LFRIVWKLSQHKVEALSNNNLEALAGHVVHIALYALLLVVMTSGYLILTADGRGIDIFNWVMIPSLGELFADQEDIAGIVHEYAAYTIIALALLHALAALKHHFINKDQTLTRMTKFH
jgi:cytochrome b561